MEKSLAISSKFNGANTLRAMLLFFFALTTLQFFSEYFTYQSSIDTLRFKPVSATINDTKTEVWQTRGHPLYQGVRQYIYKVDKREFVGSTPSMEMASIKELLSLLDYKWPLGKKITVYYDPTHKSASVVERAYESNDSLRQVRFFGFLMFVEIVLFIASFIFADWLNGYMSQSSSLADSQQIDEPKVPKW
jgi:hypothetical protein